MPTFALNFSRPGSEVVAQYYTFFRLGRAGFRAVQQASRDVAMYLADEIGALPEFPADHPRRRAAGLRVHDHGAGHRLGRLRGVPRGCASDGWQVPAYTFPADREDLAVLRVVCRNGFSTTWPSCSSPTCAPPSTR